MKNLSEKTCTKCGGVFPATAEFFYRRKDNKIGLGAMCKPCKNRQNKQWQHQNLTKHKEYLRNYYQQNKESFKQYSKKNRYKNQLRVKYGITLDQCYSMFNNQRGCCAICKACQSTLKRNLAVDHDHSTGKVRGLLCGNCNTKLGWFELYSDGIERYLNDTVVPI